MSRQTGKVYYLYIEVIPWASSRDSRHLTSSDAVFDNTINVLNIEAKVNNAIYINTITLTAAWHVTTDYGVHAAKQYTMTYYKIYKEQSTA